MPLTRLLAPSLHITPILSILTLGSFAFGCSGADASLDEEVEPGVSYAAEQLSVGGHRCPQRGEVAGRKQPADHRYFLTTFGGGRDTQRMACGGIADGRSLYLADSWRFGCGAHVRITNPRNGRSCVAKVADIGPNVCVEQAAHRPVVDASPAVARHLFGERSLGWSDRRPITAVAVGRSEPLGCR